MYIGMERIWLEEKQQKVYEDYEKGEIDLDEFNLRMRLLRDCFN